MKIVTCIVLCLVLVALVAVGPSFAIRIYLNPSDQIHNTSPDGTYNESYACRDVAWRLANKLGNRGFEVWNSDGASMSASCSAANSWPADRFVSIHTNAMGGGWTTAHGTMSLYYQSSGGWVDTVGRDLAIRCTNKCVEKFSAYGRGYNRGNYADYPFYGYNLYVLANTNMSACLVEGLFHDNWDDVQLLKTDAGKEAYAQALYEAICDHFGWSYSSTPPNAMASPCTVGRNQDGRLEVFARGYNNQIYHNYQNPDRSWSGWTSLGGDIRDIPVVAMNSDGRLEVFARGADNSVVHCWQTAPNSGWSQVYSMGGNITGVPVLGTLPDGRLEMFVRWSNGAVYHAWQTPPNGWSGFASLGGSITDIPAVGRNQDGRMEVFARTSNGTVWHNYHLTPYGSWSGWYTMNGNISYQPVVAMNSNGTLELFARGIDGTICHCWQTEPNAGWSAWYGMGGSSAGAPAVGTNSDGRLELFVRTPSGEIQHCWQEPWGGWSAWWGMGSGFSNPPAVGQNSDGRLELFARGNDGIIYHSWQQPDTTWSAWYPL